MITDDPFTVGANNWEINLLPALERSDGETFYEAPNVDINYGAGYRAQLKFETPWMIRTSRGEPAESGMGNVGVGMRYRFIDQSRHGFAMSTYPALAFSGTRRSVRRGLADAHRSVFLPVEIATTVKGFGINGEAGYLFERGADSWQYGFLVGRDQSERVEMLGEIHGESDKDLSRTELLANFGSRLGLTDHLTILVSAGRSFYGADHPTTIAALGFQVTVKNTPERAQ